MLKVLSFRWRPDVRSSLKLSDRIRRFPKKLKLNGRESSNTVRHNACKYLLTTLIATVGDLF